MATRFLPLVAFLICALLLGCGIHPASVRLTTPTAAAQPPVQASAEPAVYPAGKLPEPTQTVRTGRYSYVDVGPQPDQMDPLLAVIDVHLPKGVETVKEAVNHLLRRSGFTLLPADPGDYPVACLLSQPLPDIHRHLGPVSLRDALLTLGGKAFIVNVDYVYRKVGYQVSPAYAGRPHS